LDVWVQEIRVSEWAVRCHRWDDGKAAGFRIGQADNGKWYAARDESPCFCFEGDTAEEADGIAHDALVAYREMKAA